jgi:hypothetical protein
MSHGPVCPCPNCRSGSGGLWLLLAVACAVVAVACYFAARAAVAWLAGHLLIDGLLVWLLALGGFGLACKARTRGRAGLPNPARPVSRVPPKPAGVSERLSVPHPRDGGRR